MSEEGFLSRWSRRKRAAEAGRPAEEPAPAAPDALSAAAPTPAEPPADPRAEQRTLGPAEPEFDPATLPPLESLTAGSDFSAFLRKEVPEALKRAALRKAWTLDPAIRDFVGLADYDWDFNAPAGVPGFALDLGGDAKEMLARLFGPTEAVADEAAAGTARPAPAPAPADPAGEDDRAPPEAPPAIAAAAPEEEAGPRPTAPRRHGGAVPS